MSRIKRLITIIGIMVVTMLIIPVITINTVKADAGMLIALMLFFILNPIVSVAVGILASRDIKFFWFAPILLAVLFWVFSCFAYEPAFPIVYSVIYFVISSISMLIATLVIKNQSN